MNTEIKTVNQHTTAIRYALTNAVHGLPTPMSEASELLKTICEFSTTADLRDTCNLGSFALQLLLDKLKADLNCERESRMLVDKLRKP